MYQRTFRLEADVREGQISGTLATDGEASDGHILSIEGGDIRPGIPFLFAHEDGAFSSPALANLGSWVEFEKIMAKAPGQSRIRGTAAFELDGSGSQLEWRQDVHHMVQKGHVQGLSLRWDADPGNVKRRVNLPSDHPAFVDAETEPDIRKRTGLFFEKWVGLEGSLVSIGADKQAMVGRVREADTAGARDHWRQLLEGVDASVGLEGLRADLERIRLELEQHRQLLQAIRSSISWAAVVTAEEETISPAPEPAPQVSRVVEPDHDAFAEVVREQLAGMRDRLVADAVQAISNLTGVRHGR